MAEKKKGIFKKLLDTLDERLEKESKEKTCYCCNSKVKKGKKC